MTTPYRVWMRVFGVLLLAGCAHPRPPSPIRAAEPASAPASQAVAPAEPASAPSSAPLTLPAPAAVAASLATSAPASGPFLLVERPEAPAAPEDNARTRFWYQAGRKATIGMMAGMNSEFLFTNQPLGPSAIDSAMIYVPSFILMDEVIQRYNLDAASTFYLGSLYGLWLEGMIVGSISEAPGFFLTYVTTFWHGLLTTYSAAEVTENLFPRRAPGRYQRRWLIAGGVVTGLGTLLFLPASGPAMLANPVAIGATLGTGGLFTYLLARRVRSGEHDYKPRPWLAMGLMAAGFGLGFVHQLQQEEGEPTYETKDHLARGGTYFALELGMLVNTLRKPAPRAAHPK